MSASLNALSRVMHDDRGIERSSSPEEMGEEAKAPYPEEGEGWMENLGEM
jgi:hypothetical protein